MKRRPSLIHHEKNVQVRNLTSDYRTFLLERWSRHDVDAVHSLKKVGTVDADAGPCVAHVNHGRWIVVCPDCRVGAQFAAFDRPFYFCLECINAAIGGRCRIVVWPEDYAEAEALLKRRPLPATRNYDPRRGETAVSLLSENRSRGIL